MTASRTSRCYWVESPGRGALRADAMTPAGPEDVLVVTEFSGISPGTERLVGNGQVPAAVAQQMACYGMKGTFALPIAYGYSLVGRTAAGDRVFTMHPHQDRCHVSRDRLVELPDAVPASRATLFPNLETALNATWDAELRGDERTLVIGAGAVGCLLAFVLARLHHGPVTLVEQDASRRERATALPWVSRAIAPGAVATGTSDVAFHATGSGSGLQLAIDAVGFEGRVIELSWYGTREVTLRLGETFHHQRKRIVSSQVATVAPSHRAAGYAARTAAVLELLHDTQLDELHGEPIPFTDLPTRMAALYRGDPIDSCPIVRYDQEP
ncbi:MAG: zinc-binding alcohol dehydrogenase [bacterium]|nr:zinc-binding alcohol dehydrogenase [bacterium]